MDSQLLKEIMIVFCLGALFPVCIVCILSLLVSFFQMMTQIQEQSISFFVKIVALIGCLFILSDPVGNRFKSLIQISFKNIAQESFNK